MHVVHPVAPAVERRQHVAAAEQQVPGVEGQLQRVEAEQDPAKAPPMEYSQMGYSHIIEVLDASGLATA